jgi:elongation factor P
MIPVTQLRAGTTFKIDDQIFEVLVYKHTKMGRGNANIRVKARRISDGSVIEKTFNSGARVEPVETETRLLQYLYKDGKECFFMDPRGFEQFSLPVETFGKKEKFLKEGQEVKILFMEGKPASFQLPNSMVFGVVDTPPGIKGDTVSGGSKTVTLDNGLTIRAPLFIKKGDKLKVDTRTGEYLERLKS